MKLTLPISLEPRRDEIAEEVMFKKRQFFPVCEAWRTPSQCIEALSRVEEIVVVDDYKFPLKGTPTGTASAQWLKKGRLIQVCLYNITNSSTGIKTRTREQMADLAIGKAAKKYWLSQPEWVRYAGNPNNLLPALVHEF